MKRHKNIQPLSRDHHFGLLFCWKIRKGLTNQTEIERINHYINYFWNFHLHQHFIAEETILFNTIKDKLCDDGFSQHAEIASQLHKINSFQKTDSKAYRDLADLIDAHIRFEERILFPHLEKMLSPNQMTIIGLELEQWHNEPLEEEYKDEFWIH